MADKASETEVLVVGAGPTGLTAAIELALRKIAVRVVDKVPARPPTESRALGTNTRSQEIFERHGSLAGMQAVGLPVYGMSFVARGRRFARLALAAPNGVHPVMIQLRQAETEQALLDRLAALGVTVERPVELEAVLQDAEGVHATLVHPDGRRESLRVPYVIGADGARSGVRKALGVAFVGEVAGEREYLADVMVEWRGGARWLTDEGNDVRMFLVPTGFVAFAPLASGRWRVFTIAPPGDPRFESDHPTLEQLQRIVDESPNIGARLYDLSWVAAFTQSARKVAQLRHGRVFLAGDAAHIHSPFGGQGMNTGVADAANLAWKLALRLRGFGDEALLDSYHAERNPIVEKLMRVTKGGPKLFVGAARHFAALRVPLLAVASRVGLVAPLASRWLSGQANHYRGSSIVADASADEARGPLAALRTRRRHGVAVPGDRAPDAGGLRGGGRARRLFELWINDPRQQLLVFAGERATADRVTALRTVTRSLAARYGTLVRTVLVHRSAATAHEDDVVDSTGELARRYGAETERLVLVRPDGYLGFRGDPTHVDALEAYLARVFHA